MDLNKPTPGRWIATDDFINVCSADTGKIIACLDSEGAPDIGPKESLANAYLIAAAPDLLSALQGMVQEFGNQKFDVRKDYHKMVAMEAAKTAIAKTAGMAETVC